MSSISVHSKRKGSEIDRYIGDVSRVAVAIEYVGGGYFVIWESTNSNVSIFATHNLYLVRLENKIIYYERQILSIDETRYTGVTFDGRYYYITYGTDVFALNILRQYSRGGKWSWNLVLSGGSHAGELCFDGRHVIRLVPLSKNIYLYNLKNKKAHIGRIITANTANNLYGICFDGYNYYVLEDYGFGGFRYIDKLSRDGLFQIRPGQPESAGGTIVTGGWDIATNGNLLYVCR